MKKLRSYFVWDEYQKLRLKISLILTCLPIVVWSIVALFFYIILELNFLYLNSYFPDATLEIRQKFELFFGEKYLFYVIVFGSYLVLNLFCGLHIAARLVRPFRRMAEFCQKATSNPNMIYEPDFFSDFKFLTSFTDYFFSHLQQSRQKKTWHTQTIPPHYGRVRGPVFERSFFLSLFFVFSAMTILAVTFLYFLTIDLHSDLFSISINTLKKHGPPEVFFLKDQGRLLNSIIYYSAGLLLITYSVLITYFYQLASGAAFAFFSTFRSFIRGQTHSRVHLIGHAFLRDYGREVNQYLKVVSRELVTESSQHEIESDEESQRGPSKVA